MAPPREVQAVAQQALLMVRAEALAQKAGITFPFREGDLPQSVTFTGVGVQPLTLAGHAKNVTSRGAYLCAARLSGESEVFRLAADTKNVLREFYGPYYLNDEPNTGKHPFIDVLQPESPYTEFTFDL